MRSLLPVTVGPASPVTPMRTFTIPNHFDAVCTVCMGVLLLLKGRSLMSPAEGQVAYYTMWTHAPNLNDAINALMQQGGRGVVNGGIDHVMHLLPTITHGWRGIQRGLPQSYLDLDTAAPGMGSGIWLGYQIRSLLASVTLRAELLSPPERAVVALGAVLAGVVTVRALRR